MGFASESRERAKPVVPLAGMVDILFLLLIFFMTASTLRDQELQMQIALPGSENSQLTANLDAMQTSITVDKFNNIFLGQRQVTMPELRDVLSQLAKDYPNETLVIRGDRESSYGTAIEIIDLAQALGINDVRAAEVKKASAISSLE
ncbi:biopolymer transport protein ExbD [Poriferisphaera corsica]|uniref:Biopolymer transport protein ExbD n=1 Tax=Poriferisphaera corsica TaxID=2528020 RepID=A0A517YXC2_9BACT|nr:biopolymer transporter ExbD [Poriferisphaera corsica]QDU34869.1 biopolymer transport protein ExbD [Poriferisphaera corsica]